MAAVTSPTAILFDLDGVIVDSESIHHRAYELALTPYGVSSIPLEIYADRFSNRGVGLEYCAEVVPGLDSQALKQDKNRLFRELLETDARPLPGVPEVVRALAANRPLAVATGSGHDAAAFVLERFGLRDCFQAVVAREDYERDKPEPDAFLRACATLGLLPESCLVVEDSSKGLRAARAAGIPCVVVPNDYTRGADFSTAAAILSSIRELTFSRAERIHRSHRG
jgi:HAD superfamily hydrolase (TIGR01509 family)